MKTFLILSISLFLNFVANGQKSNLQSKKIVETYTWRTATPHQIDSFYFDLQPLQQVNYPFYIRISLINGQIIDLYSLDNITYEGLLTNYIKEIRNVETSKSQYAESEDYRYFFEKIKLDRKQVANVVQHILTTRLLDISLDTSKSERKTHFLDCGSIYIQSNINGTYRNIKFECPWGQKDTVTWKKTVMENYHFFKAEFQLDSLNNVFKFKLPKGNLYTYNGPDIMILPTKKQSKQWQKRKPYREYFLSIEDTLYNYLENEVGKQKILLNGMICSEDYYFLFKKGGAFKKVKVGKYKRKYQIEEKQEIRQCKKKMKEIFSQINLDWMNLKYDIVFSCSFNREGKIKFGKFY